MLKRTQLAELPPRPGASPGLLRRRYSMPEIIMRKYRLAQQKSDSEESAATTAPSRAASPASPSPPRGSCASLCEPHTKFSRRDREPLRKSALLRRLWARPNCNPCPACCYCSGEMCESQGDYGRETRSLDGSRSELRHLSSSFTSSRYSKESHMLSGWSTPKRQRLEYPNNFHSSDEMLRTAMRNSYERAEELRHEIDARDEMSDSTFQSHGGASPYRAKCSATQIAASRNSDSLKIFEDSSNVARSESVSELATSEDTNNSTAEQRCTDSTYSPTQSTEKEVCCYSVGSQTNVSNNKHIDLLIKEETDGTENNDKNIYNKSPNNENYEILEIVVSETLNPSFKQDNLLAIDNKTNTVCEPQVQIVEEIKNPMVNNNKWHNIDIDQYVSNILVESLNSLTDQLEIMNASMGSERKISIVEKEIKVKLQNTGVNTIVHLSPTSNNQIIFGNEELYNKEENKGSCNTIQCQDAIGEEVYSVESNNNTAFTETSIDKSDYKNEHNFANENFELIPHDSVNQAVLQQIQKLFQDELQHVVPDNYTGNLLPGISHIEVSNVDVFIDNNQCDSNFVPTNVITIETENINSDQDSNIETQDVLSSVGSGNYYKNVDDPVLIPRFSALPHSDSMEVNTSSSEDVEIIGSECTSLVDSLDDPNSPRSVLLRKSCNKRSELVRSAIDILDLLPESAFVEENCPKEKSEAFFIRIKDNDCDCEKENIIVADHMPEIIKQRLYRRHRKREMRMECARRKKVKQFKKDNDKFKSNGLQSKKETEKDCSQLVDTLIDEVICKIAQEECNYMKIKQNGNKVTNKKHNYTQENKLLTQNRNTWKKDINYDNTNVFKITKNGTIQLCEQDIDQNYNNPRRSKDRHRIYGKMSLQAHPPITPDDCGPKRIYQKSEIHDGSKCIEILEILEYVDTSQSSPETTNSDENLNSQHTKRKLSKIPVPVYEKISKLPKSKSIKSYKSTPTLNCEKNYKSNRLTNSIILDDLNNENNTDDVTPSITKDRNQEFTLQLPSRRASVPHETRSRSNSLRFKQVFDIIPEEKSSFSIESSSEDINYNRRVSAPNLTQTFTENNNNNVKDDTMLITRPKESPKNTRKYSLKDTKETKSVGTSPLNENSGDNTKSPQRKINKNAMTSPLRKSASTSPILSKLNKNIKSCGTNTNSGKSSLSSHGTKAGWLGFYKPNKEILEEEGIIVSCAHCH